MFIQEKSNQKYLIRCFDNQQKPYRFGKILGREAGDNLFLSELSLYVCKFYDGQDQMFAQPIADGQYVCF